MTMSRYLKVDSKNWNMDGKVPLKSPLGDIGPYKGHVPMDVG